MKIAVTGAGGFVGNKIMEHYPDAIRIPSLQGKSEEEIRRIIGSIEADVLIHTAAVSDIGACEKDPDGSYHANVVIPTWIAESFAGKKRILFSSDQVYSGRTDAGPYTEDMVAPGNLYAEEKLEMENRVLDIDPTAVMLRAEWMYDYRSYKGNYYLNVLGAADSVAFSSAQYRGITYVKEVAEAMPKVWELPGGAYNFGSETERSMYEITKEFVRMIGKDVVVKDEGRKRNLWMDCSKARALGVAFSEVSVGLKRCFEDHNGEKTIPDMRKGS